MPRYLFALTRRSRRGASASLLLAVVVALLAVLAPSGRADAQGYFGQNQVQYQQFKWRVLETEHFLVHYYPEERVAVMDAARMLERGYARLSRLLDHQFREKKPIVLFASRTDFAQNNVTGDLGEGTGGVAEPVRHRMLLPFTGDYKSFEHVLLHELTHGFQYDVYARGRAGMGLQNLQQNQMPLWFAEGMAEYLSLGPLPAFKNATLRDAALNGNLPTVEQMTMNPNRYFPYTFGHAFWAYVGKKWGDEVIGQILNAVPNIGIQRAFRRETGMSLEDLGEEWKEAMQTQHLANVSGFERPRAFAKPLLSQRRSGGLAELFVAPALSSDGKHIAFISYGSFLRGEVFPDLHLADGETGKRIKRLVRSTTNPDFEELRILYSQSAFSPDGRRLAFTGQRRGRDVLYILDVRTRKTIKRLDLPLEGATNPTWSPDATKLVFTGNAGGITDLYMVNTDGSGLRKLTDDRHGDLMPHWSPDGKTIAFATDRGDQANFDVLRLPPLRVALYDLATGNVTVLPDQMGLNINPQWAPDGRSIAFVSDRNGSPNLFLYDFEQRDHYQLTNLAGSLSAFSETSPAISWAHRADRLAFTYMQNGDYTVWSLDNPRGLKRLPYRTPVAPLVAAGALPGVPGVPGVPGATPGASPATTAPGSVVAVAPSAPVDTTATTRTRSYYRVPGGFRRSGVLANRGDRPREAPLSIAALLDSVELALPDTAKFQDRPYKIRFQPDYVARPSVGFAPDNFGRNVFGGTTVVLSDMLGNHQLAVSTQVNGRISEAFFYGGYTNLAGRWQHSNAFSQQPFYFLQGNSLEATSVQGLEIETQQIATYIVRNLSSTWLHPFTRFSRVETGASLNSIGRQSYFISREVFQRSIAGQFVLDSMVKEPALNFAQATAAYVSDNTLFGYTAPIYGRRFRFQVSPTVGQYRWMQYLADYRRYDPLLFNFLTVATRLYSDVSIGRDETAFPKYIGRADFVRGYDRSNSLAVSCPVVGANANNCSATQLLGSRVAVANAELRFPLIRRFELGFLPIALPPLDGLFFYDVGLAWSKGQSVYGGPGPAAAPGTPPRLDTRRFPLRSYGAGLRLNLFNYALVRWDYAIPLDSPNRRGFWTWSLWPSF